MGPDEAIHAIGHGNSGTDPHRTSDSAYDGLAHKQEKTKARHQDASCGRTGGLMQGILRKRLGGAPMKFARRRLHKRPFLGLPTVLNCVGHYGYAPCWKREREYS